MAGDTTGGTRRGSVPTCPSYVPVRRRRPTIDDQQFGIDTRKPRQAKGAGSALWHNMFAESWADRQSERAPPCVYDARRPASSHQFKSGMLVRNIAYAALSGDEDRLLAGADTRQRVPVRLSTRVDLICPAVPAERDRCPSSASTHSSLNRTSFDAPGCPSRPRLFSVVRGTEMGYATEKRNLARVDRRAPQDRRRPSF
jgi:hypothetical protein